MLDATPTRSEDSPFHAGEQELQTRTGKRETMETFARRVVRPYMPDQHRDFFAQLPFIVVGGVDDQAWPWASILSGQPGFMNSPNPATLNIAAAFTEGDPLAPAMAPAIASGRPLGLLGIDLAERRRNRLNGRIATATDSGFSLSVDQSFGNCPQYIQNRSVEFVREPAQSAAHADVTAFSTLDDSAHAMIQAADTFFVSSFVQTADRPDIEGVDVSHRGGNPGFVKVEGDTLTIPDFPGNYHFNTLGNFLLNPKAGLVFADFTTGDVLQLTGTVELLWDADAEVQAFTGAERAWRFTLDHGVRLAGALPFRAVLKDVSPYTLLTGDWDQAAATLSAEAKRNAWRSFRVARIEDESSVIRSFYFEPTDGEGLLPFEAGQFLTLRLSPDSAAQPVIRTYTVSSAPGEALYRISVKREADGLVSKHLHDTLKVGDSIEMMAPRGDFFIDPTEIRPAVLLAGGVGITPMISMARHVAREGVRTRHLRSLTVLHAAQTTAQRAFADDLRELDRSTDGAIRYYSFIGQPTPNDKPGEDFNGTGRITADALRQVLALDDYDFYLCGPPSFMQGLYDTLRDLGVRDARIFAEAFGPAALTRRPDQNAAPAATSIPEAEDAVITFAKSGVEQRWSAGEATILETAEAHGLTPAFGCRNGVCGTCAVKLKSGAVAYRTPPSATPAADEVLICCAVPAEGADTVELDM